MSGHQGIEISRAALHMQVGFLLHVLCPMRVIAPDPWPVSLREIVTVAHMATCTFQKIPQSLPGASKTLD